MQRPEEILSQLNQPTPSAQAIKEALATLSIKDESSPRESTKASTTSQDTEDWWIFLHSKAMKDIPDSEFSFIRKLEEDPLFSKDLILLRDIKNARLEASSDFIENSKIREFLLLKYMMYSFRVQNFDDNSTVLLKKTLGEKVVDRMIEILNEIYNIDSGWDASLSEKINFYGHCSELLEIICSKEDENILGYHSKPTAWKLLCLLCENFAERESKAKLDQDLLMIRNS